MVNGIKEKKSFNITLLDTPERFKNVTNNNIQKSNGIILIYDITNRNTFGHVDEWLDRIRENLLIGKKLII